MATVLTWNINSIRQRLDALARIARLYEPSVICLQETKVQNQDFPLDFCQTIGYQHCIYEGIPSYNGVAILSKLPIERHGSHPFCGKNDARYLWAEAGGVIFHNFYVPSGGNVPSLDATKFAHKISFVEEMQDVLLNFPLAHIPQILLGDLNIAPLPEDVFDHHYMSKIVAHTPIEVDTLTKTRTTTAFFDNVRHSYGNGVPVFTWWSYRGKSSTTNQGLGRGLRLDHVWTKIDPQHLEFTSATILCEVRNWEKPSDHAPIMLSFPSF